MEGNLFRIMFLHGNLWWCCEFTRPRRSTLPKVTFGIVFEEGITMWDPTNPGIGGEVGLIFSV